MKHENNFHFHDLPAPSGETKSLIVILHGHGSHPDKFIKWAKKAQEENPDADVLIVRGPVATHATPEQKAQHRMTGPDDLYSWGPGRATGLGKLRGILSAVFNHSHVIDQLNEFINFQLQQRGLNDQSLAFIGFSQGGIVATQAAMRRPEKCAAVVCHSSLVFPGTHAEQKPDTLVIMGDQDEILRPPKKSLLKNIFNKVAGKVSVDHPHSVARLKKLGVPVTEKIFPGQTHRVTEASWKEAAGFVAKRLKK